MTARTNLVKSSLLALTMGAALSTSGIANAQTIVYAAGGSSALQGNFGAGTTGGSGSLSLGAIPYTLVSFVGDVTGFDTGAGSVGTTSQGIITANVTISGENTTGALVLYTSSQASTSTSAANTNIIILVRSDSGYGVRYVALQEQITNWTFVQAYSYASSPVARANTALDTAVETYLSANANTSAERIYNGLSDVSADAIENYSGFSGIGTSTAITNLNNATHDILPVQTLVFLYNKNHGLGNVTRTQAKSLIGGLTGSATGSAITWGQILGTAETNAVDAYYRESTSGTRTTELLNVQRSGPLTAADTAPNSFASIIAENQPGLGSFNPITNSGVIGSNYGVGATTTLSAAAAAGAATISLTSITGVVEGQPLYIVDGANSETVTVSSTVAPAGGVVTLKAGTTTSHAHALGTTVQLANANGTGNMVNAVNFDSNGFGYAFITGGAGSGKTNIEVASYDGVLPLDTTVFPKAADGGQAQGGVTYGLNASTYYPAVAKGQYELWAFGNQYEAGDEPKTTQDSNGNPVTVASQVTLLLDSTLTEQQVHSLGFTRVSDMLVTRVATFGTIVTGDSVTDGQLITFDLSAGPNPPASGLGGLTNGAGNSAFFGSDPTILPNDIE